VINLIFTAAVGFSPHIQWICSNSGCGGVILVSRDTIHRLIPSHIDVFDPLPYAFRFWMLCRAEMNACISSRVLYKAREGGTIFSTLRRRKMG